MTWRESSRTEIQAYYDDEFPTYQSDLPSFITADAPKEYALAFKSAYPTVDTGTRPFIRRSTRPTNDPDTPGTPVFNSLEDVLAFIRHPADNDPLDGRSALADPELVDYDRPVADAVYYAADMWERSWLLWVDIDAKDVAHERASEYAPEADDPVHATGITAAAPKGYPYAFEDIEQAIKYGFEVEAFFSDRLCGEETMVIYSGQGCHVYLLDDDPYHRYDEASRELINDVLRTDYDIPIDTVVTADQSRVARLPYSLHADVSRIVTPITDSAFDFRTEPKPCFLEDNTPTGDDTDAISLPGETQ